MTKQPQLDSPVKLNINAQPVTYKQIRTLLGKDYAGEQLNTKIIEFAKAQTTKLGCFVAGTLVHTKEGLRPIEQIKVGDYVLSKPESGTGELSYKRVSRTYEYEDKEVFFVSWDVFDPATNKYDSEHVVVTGEHPFWIESLIDTRDDSGVRNVSQWMSVRDLWEQVKVARVKHFTETLIAAKIHLLDGRMALIGYTEPVLRTANPDIGLVFVYDEYWSENYSGTAVYFNENGPETKMGASSYEDTYMRLDDAVGYEDHDPDSVVYRSRGYLQMQRKVYNLEVEDNHTYFVGKDGVFVHNMCGPKYCI